MNILAELEQKLSPFVRGFEAEAKTEIDKARAEAEAEIRKLRADAAEAVATAKADAERELTDIEPKVKAAVLAAISKAFEALLASSVL